jgi:molecular chaperone HtpG
VLLLADRVDAWIMDRMPEYEGKRFQDAARGDLGLERLDATVAAAREEAARGSRKLLKRIKDALGERVAEVRVSERLAETTACLVRGEHDAGAQLRRVLEAAGQKVPADQPVLEVNVTHPVIRHLEATEDGAQFEELARLVHDQALLAEGATLPNPGDFVRRLNRVLERLAVR